MENRPRPEGFNYSIPDPIAARCLECNQDGMNRTSLKPVAHMGTSTTGAWAIKCPSKCDKGLKWK